LFLRIRKKNTQSVVINSRKNKNSAAKEKAPPKENFVSPNEGRPLEVEVKNEISNLKECEYNWTDNEDNIDFDNLEDLLDDYDDFEESPTHSKCNLPIRYYFQWRVILISK
jgi:hypothetical protein